MSANGNRTYVIGVGMTKFDKPGTKEGDYPDWAKEAGEKALADAGIPYEDVEQAYVGYCYGESTYGQRALYQLGLTGIPVVNVNNNCSTGSSALFLARQAVKGGLADCALALGFEKMEKGSLGVKYTDRTNALDKHAMAMFALREPEESPRGAADVRQRRARPHGEVRLRARPLRLDRVEEPQALGQQPVRAVSGRVHARRDQGVARDPRAADQAPVLADLRRLGLRDRRLGALRRRARPRGAGGRDRRPGDGHRPAHRPSPTTPTASRSSATTCRRRRPTRPTRRPASRPRTSTSCELHDCFSANELITYEALGFAAEGEGHKLVEAEATTYGGDGPRRQPLRRADLEGPPAGRHGARAVLRAHLAAARRRRQAPGRRRRGGAAAQHRPRRRRGRVDLQAREVGP